MKAQKRNIIYRILNVLFIRNFKYLLWHFGAYCPVCPGLFFKYIRPWTWKVIGVKMGKNLRIGSGVYLDVDGSDRITIGDYVSITAECLILLHRKDVSRYYSGEYKSQRDLPYITPNTIICDNVTVGMRSIILPGVTIGEGAVVGAGSVVTKNVEPFTVVAGNPAKIIKKIFNNNNPKDNDAKNI